MAEYVSPFNEWPKNSDHFKTIPLDNLKFVFDQASARLKDSFDSGGSLLTRAYNFISVVVVLFSAIGTYVVSKLETCPHDNIFYTSIGALAYLLILLIYLFKAVRPITIKSIGTEPSFLLKKTVVTVEQGEDEETAKKFTIFNQIGHYDKRIFYCVANNNKKGRIIRRSMNSLLLFPFIMGLLYFILGIKLLGI